MGLDISFFKTESVGYFRKVNFILTYFDIDESKNLKNIEIGKEKFIEFLFDLSRELLLYDKRKEELKEELEDANANLEPLNPKLKTCGVFFGGSTEYDSMYWQDIRNVYDWGENLMRTFDWDNCGLQIQCWW